METITIKRKLVEDALKELKAAQIDLFVQSTQNIIDDLEASLRPPSVQVGTVLIAVDPCRMEGGNEEALIVGKEYKVEYVCNGQVVIIDEGSHEHFFDLDTLNKFFKIKPAS